MGRHYMHQSKFTIRIMSVIELYCPWMKLHGTFRMHVIMTLCCKLRQCAQGYSLLLGKNEQCSLEMLNLHVPAWFHWRRGQGGGGSIW